MPIAPSHISVGTRYSFPPLTLPKKNPKTTVARTSPNSVMYRYGHDAAARALNADTVQESPDNAVSRSSVNLARSKSHVDLSATRQESSGPESDELSTTETAIEHHKADGRCAPRTTPSRGIRTPLLPRTTGTASRHTPRTRTQAAQRPKTARRSSRARTVRPGDLRVRRTRDDLDDPATFAHGRGAPNIGPTKGAGRTRPNKRRPLWT